VIVRLEVTNGDEIAERIAEILTRKLDEIAARVPAQRGGANVYVRPDGDPGDGGRRYRGPRLGGLADDGTLVDETGAAS
jgi:hypothetical protein